MFSKISASKFFVIFDAFDFIVVFFDDPNRTEWISKSSDINSKFGKSQIIIIFNGVWNSVIIDPILIYRIDGKELISKALFISPSGLKGEEENVIINRNVCDESVYTIKSSDV